MTVAMEAQARTNCLPWTLWCIIYLRGCSRHPSTEKARTRIQFSTCCIIMSFIRRSKSAWVPALHMVPKNRPDD